MVHARQATICKTMGPIEEAQYGKAGDVGDVVVGQGDKDVALVMTVNHSKEKADRGRMYG